MVILIIFLFRILLIQGELHTTLVMGIDVGVIVTEQITDEYLWFIAMEEIRTAFEGKEYFNNLFQQEEEASKLGEVKMKIL